MDNWILKPVAVFGMTLVLGEVEAVANGHPVNPHTPHGDYDLAMPRWQAVAVSSSTSEAGVVSPFAITSSSLFSPGFND